LAVLLSVVLLFSLVPTSVFAETQKEYVQSFDGAELSSVVKERHASGAALTAATNDSASHGDVLQLDVKPQGNYDYYLWESASNSLSEITSPTLNGSLLSGTAANGVAFTNATVNTAKPVSGSFTSGGKTYCVVSGAFADAYVGAGNIATATVLNNPAFSNTNGRYVAIKLDLYLSADFACSAGISSRIGSSGGNVELFEIKSSGTAASFDHHENGVDLSGGAVTLSLGKWHSVAILIDLSTAQRSVFVNGTMASVQQNTSAPVNTSISLTEKSFGFQTDRSGAPTSYGGYVQYDNVEMYFADEDEFTRTYVDFSDEGVLLTDASLFPSVPSLAKTVTAEDGNRAVYLDMSAASSEDSYALITRDGRSVKAWNLEWDPTSPSTGTVDGTPYTFTWEPSTGKYITTYDGTVVYVVRDSLAETACGAANVAKAFKVGHTSFTYDTTPQLLLEAKYFIEENSTGKLEIQFEGYKYNAGASTGTWIQMYVIEMDSGRFDGTNMHLSIGEWNTVTVFFNLETGVYDMYVNNVFAKQETVGATNLSVGYDNTSKWSFAKIQRSTNITGAEYSGGVYIDDVLVTSKVDLSNADLNGKVLDENALSRYVQGALEIVEGASIRLAEPTGLRFATRVDTHVLEHLSDLFGDAAIKDMGTLIAPADYVTRAGAFTKEALDALGNATNYLDVKFDGVYYPYAEAVGLPEGDYMAGSITNIRASNVSREFAAIGYVTLEIDGDEYTFYSDMTKRSIKNVAIAALADENIQWNRENLDILTAFANGTVPAT